MDAQVLIAAAAGAGGVLVPAGIALRQVSAQVRKLRGQLTLSCHHATHDGLTGLLNWSGFHAQAAPVVAAPGDRARAVLFFDLDDFKVVNDVHGHGVGDVVLMAVAEHLRTTLGEDALLARYGGDEFAAVLSLDPGEDLGDLDTWLAAAAVVCVYVAAGVHLVQRASIGVAVAHGPADLTVQLERADRASYRAKRTGRSIAWYTPGHDDHPTPPAETRPAAQVRGLSHTEAVEAVTAR